MARAVLLVGSKVRAVQCVCFASAAFWALRADASMSRSGAGKEVRWASPTIELSIVAPGRGDDISTEDLQKALQSGLATWNEATERCKVPELRLNKRIETQPWLAQDGRSLVMVRTRKDCERDSDLSSLCLEPDTAARTHLYPRQQPGSAADGLIEEADLELNALSYRWSLEGGADGRTSLRRLIHHELGHVLGLSHPCRQILTKGRTFDERTPDCRTSGMSDRLMHPAAADMSRATSLGPDESEIEELCTLYGRRPSNLWRTPLAALARVPSWAGWLASSLLPLACVFLGRLLWNRRRP